MAIEVMIVKEKIISAALAAAIGAGAAISPVYAAAEPEIVDYDSFKYADTIFDDSYVHKLDIEIDESAWHFMADNATEEMYVPCSITYDDKTMNDSAIRPKGNSSLKSVSAAGNERFSFKLEFDHFHDGVLLDGLDKLSLNNLGQDTSCMKDYLTYHMMNEMGVSAPLSSFVFVTVNGEDFGLYLAVEAIEDSFAVRNWGVNHGNLYKPDSFGVDNLNVGIGNEQLDDVMAILKGEPYKNLKGGDRVDFIGNLINIMLPHMGISTDAAAGMYLGEDEDAYNVIFDTAVFDITEEQKWSYIDAVKTLQSSNDPAEALYADDVLKYFVVHSFVDNYDSYTSSFVHNFYYYENDGKLSIVPWDYNIAYGAFTYEAAMASLFEGRTDIDMIPDTGDAMDINTSMVNFPIDTPFFSSDINRRPMLGKLLENDYYKNLYHKYYNEFVNKMFLDGRFEQIFTTAKNNIAPYTERGRNLYTKEQFERGTKAVHDFCILRGESVKRQLDGSLPATLDGQSKDFTNLVDTGDLKLSDAIDFSGLMVGINPDDVPAIMDAVLGDSDNRSIAGVADSIEGLMTDKSQIMTLAPKLLTQSSIQGMLVQKAMLSVVSVMSVSLLLVALVILKKFKRKTGVRLHTRKKRVLSSRKEDKAWISDMSTNTKYHTQTY